MLLHLAMHWPVLVNLCCLLCLLLSVYVAARPRLMARLGLEFFGSLSELAFKSGSEVFMGFDEYLGRAANPRRMLRHVSRAYRGSTSIGPNVTAVLGNVAVQAAEEMQGSPSINVGDVAAAAVRGARTALAVADHSAQKHVNELLPEIDDDISAMPGDHQAGSGVCAAMMLSIAAAKVGKAFGF